MEDSIEVNEKVGRMADILGQLKDLKKLILLHSENGSSLMKEQYEQIKSYVLKIMMDFFVCEIILELPGKESFGDLDVLYCDKESSVNLSVNTSASTNIRDFITQKFNFSPPFCYDNTR